MKKKVLIIGGAGFIGSNLSRHLLDNNMEVYCFDMSKPANEIAGVNYICGDFFDDYTLEHALKGMDYVVHALSTVNPGNSNEKYLQGYERDFIQTTKLCKMIILNNSECLNRYCFRHFTHSGKFKYFLDPI